MGAARRKGGSREEQGLQAHYDSIISWFEDAMPNPQTELSYASPFGLLVAVMLSAQCTDKRVNLITPPLLRAFPTAERMAAATPLEVFEYIASCSYPNSKAKHLVAMARRLAQDFQGEVPQTREELLSLPGVGEKTANVMLSVGFRQPALAVDTHVHRVARRLGLTRNATTPSATEKQLKAHVPEELWGKAHHWLILHGRYICKARAPQCHECGLAPLCPSAKERMEKKDGDA